MTDESTPAHQLSAELQARQDEATVAQAEAARDKAIADAAKAKSDADKAAADALKAKADADKAALDVASAQAAAAKADNDAKAAADAATATANARKAEADAAKAEAEARDSASKAEKSAAEADDFVSPSARAKRIAVDEKDTAEAEKTAAAARVAHISAMIPDLSDVKESTLAIGDGPALATTPLTFKALNQAAGRAMSLPWAAPDAGGDGEQDPKAPKPPLGLPKQARVLVTSDLDLASGDATFRDVVTALRALAGSAEQIREELDRAKTDGVQTAAFTPATDVVAAVAAAIPSVLSLFSADRTLRSASSTVADIAAVAAVVAQLRERSPKLTIVHDDFRLVPASPDDQGTEPAGDDVYGWSAYLANRRGVLGAERLIVAERKATVDLRVTESAAAVKKAQKAADEADAAGKPAADLALDNALKAQAQFTSQLAADTARLASVDAALAGIDAFVTAVRAIPAGAQRSILATAALHQQFHEAGDGGYSHVLFVRAEGGQTQQVVTNKPLWFRDRFATVVDVGLTVLLIETASSNIVASGTVTGSAEAFGTLGDTIAITTRPITTG